VKHISVKKKLKHTCTHKSYYNYKKNKKKLTSYVKHISVKKNSNTLVHINLFINLYNL